MLSAINNTKELGAFNHHIKTSLHRTFILCLCFFAIGKSFSQNTTKIDLLGANSFEYAGKYGKDVKRLIGNVSFRQGGTVIYCDSAYLFDNTNSVDAYGHVRITSGSSNITSDLLKYNGNTKVAELHRNIIMRDNQMTLTTEHLNYNTNTDVANYYTGGKIVDGQSTLTSVIGYFYSNKNEFYFKNHVKLVNPEYTMNSDTMMYNTETETSYFYGPTKIVSKDNIIYCENGWYDNRNDIAQFNKNAWYNNKEQTLSGDSLYYERKNCIGKAIKNIKLVDTLQKTVITGDNANYNEKKGKTLITGNARLAQLMDKDTLFLHADTLRALFDSTRMEKTLFAYHKAKFFKSDMQGLCDSLVYEFCDSSITLFKNPILWVQQSQLTADTVKIIIGKKEIQKMYLYNTSFIVSMDDTLQAKEKVLDSIHFDQVKGKNMIGYFKDGVLRKISVFGNGETIYFVKENDGSLIGINKAESVNMNIYAEDNAIKRIVFISAPTATLYPEKDLTVKELLLKDFHWYRDKRPQTKTDIFVW